MKLNKIPQNQSKDAKYGENAAWKETQASSFKGEACRAKPSFITEKSF